MSEEFYDSKGGRGVSENSIEIRDVYVDSVIVRVEISDDVVVFIVVFDRTKERPRRRRRRGGRRCRFWDQEEQETQNQIQNQQLRHVGNETFVFFFFFGLWTRVCVLCSFVVLFEILCVCFVIIEICVKKQIS